MIATMADWVPARWPSGDPATLALLRDTPVNCLLIEQKVWSGPFAAQARGLGIAVLGVVYPGGKTLESIRTAKEQGLAGIVLDGDFPPADAASAREESKKLDLPVVALPLRRGLIFDGDSIVGTSQGVWPGIRPVDEKDTAHAMPSGGPWIDTNGGFLRYARSMHRGSFWIANLPPAKEVLPVDRYLAAIADAAILGARWVVALDADFSSRLLARDPSAVRDWNRICAYLKFYEDHKQFRALPPYAKMAVVQDASSGALLSGSVLDMIAVKHTPVRPVPGSRLTVQSLDKASMAVNVDPDGLTAEQKEALKAFTRSGGTVLNGPPGWKMPATSKNGLTVDKDDVEKLDQIWKEMNTMMGRKNLGVRLFNVSSMLSYLQASRDGKTAVLHLVNYSGYPVESVTAHVLGSFKKAYLETPEGKRKPLEAYDVEEGVGTGVDIDIVPTVAMVILEKE